MQFPVGSRKSRSLKTMILQPEVFAINSSLGADNSILKVYKSAQKNADDLTHCHPINTFVRASV